MAIATDQRVKIGPIGQIGRAQTGQVVRVDQIMPGLRGRVGTVGIGQGQEEAEGLRRLGPQKVNRRMDIGIVAMFC